MIGSQNYMKSMKYDLDIYAKEKKRNHVRGKKL